MESLELEKLGLYQLKVPIKFERTPRFSTQSFGFGYRAKRETGRGKPSKTDSTRFLSFPRTPSFRPRHFAVMDVSS